MSDTDHRSTNVRIFFGFDIPSLMSEGNNKTKMEYSKLFEEIKRMNVLLDMEKAKHVEENCRANQLLKNLEETRLQFKKTKVPEGNVHQQGQRETEGDRETAEVC